MDVVARRKYLCLANRASEVLPHCSRAYLGKPLLPDNRQLTKVLFHSVAERPEGQSERPLRRCHLRFLQGTRSTDV